MRFYKRLKCWRVQILYTMPKVTIDLFRDTFQVEEKSMFDELVEGLTHPFTIAFILLFGVGAPVIGYILKKLEEM